MISKISIISLMQELKSSGRTEIQTEVFSDNLIQLANEEEFGALKLKCLNISADSFTLWGVEMLKVLQGVNHDFCFPIIDKISAQGPGSWNGRGA